MLSGDHEYSTILNCGFRFISLLKKGKKGFVD